MKDSKRYAAAMLCLCLVMTGCAESKNAVVKASTTKLKDTDISSVMEGKIEKGKNLIYCSTFQLAWNELKDNIVKGDIKLSNEPNLAQLLNKSLSSKYDLSDKDYVAIAGFGKEDIVNKINSELKKKFGSDAPKLTDSLGPNSIISYAYLFKNLKFKYEFEKLKDPIKFKVGENTVDINGFGISSVTNNRKRDQIASQVSVIDYKNDNDFIVSLAEETGKDDIILAKINAEDNLLDTINNVSQRIAQGKKEAFGEQDILKVPAIDFYINHNYDELTGKSVENKGFEGYALTKAIQDVRFKLNEKGAELKSEAKIIVQKCVPMKKTKKLVFDKPYLVMLKEKGAKYPYLAMWIESPTELNK